MGKAMGVNTWAALAGSDDRPSSTATSPCWNPSCRRCSRPCAASGINVVAIHQHMTGEQPRVLFLHYWGIGKAADLAGARRGALKETKRDSAP